MKAPFPYYGGKSSFANLILSRIEPCNVYAEPFAGSIAVLLASKTHKYEIVCDKNGHIVNFWRALKSDPESVAYFADNPTYHHDLTARHKWLIDWGKESNERLSSDIDYYDAKAAGWWVWGQSNHPSHGGAWCTSENAPDVRPYIGPHGICIARNLGDAPIGTGDRLRKWFTSLANRLSRVIVLNRDWTAAVTPSALRDVPSATSRQAIGIVMDPPYRTDTGRAKEIYAYENQATDVAIAAYEWAIANGDSYRIAYCCHEGDFDVPTGWTIETSSDMKLWRGRQGSRDAVMFSPACNQIGKLL